MKKTFISNRLLCLLCDDLIISKHGHDIQWCSCGSCAIDGGLNYVKATGELYNYITMPVYSNKHSDHRKYLYWGRNYDKDMNRLPKTEWVLIKDMDIDHIKAVLDPRWRIGESYIKMFNRELKYRLKLK